MQNEILNFVGEEDTVAGCQLCLSCLICLTCIACAACIIPVIGQSAIAASAVEATGVAVTVSAGIISHS